MTLASIRTCAPKQLVRRARHWAAFSFVLAPLLIASLLVAPAAHAAILLFADGFESGNLSAWTSVQTGADGTATAQSVTVKTGTYAARLAATTTSGSFAYARESLANAQTDVTASGDFQVQSIGKNGGSVPILSLFGASGTKLASVNRQNKSGNILVSYGGTRTTTAASLPLNTWAQLQVHLVATGAATGTVDVVVNGATVYHSTTATLPATGFSSVQIGNETAAQAFAIVADNISVGWGSPPTNTSPPTISGNAVKGYTLTAGPGTWSGTAPITYTNQWRRCDGGGANCADVAGATGSTYVLGPADVGATMRVTVTATNAVGTSSAVSAATAVVAASASPPTNTALPTISGTPTQGSTLTASPGTWSGTAPITYGYQWQRCDSGGANCNAVSGATSSAYTLGAADVNTTMRVVVTATNFAGSGVATSNPTAVVQSGSTQSGLVALWHMDETSGSVMHDSVAGHDGTAFSVALGQPGFLGTAFGFNGTSSYVSVPSASDLNAGSLDITITIHLKTTRAPSTPDWDLIRKGYADASGGLFKMEYQPSGQATCGFKGTVDHDSLTAGPALNDGTWHTVQCVKTSSSIKVIVDGQTFSKSATIGSIVNTESVLIGAHGAGSELFNGSLDEASIQIG